MKLVPTNKLLFWFGLIYLPLSILVVLVPGSAAVGILLAMGLLILVIIDVVVSRSCLTGIHVALPDVVRLSAGREGQLSLSIENDDLKARRLRLGLALPAEIYSPHQDRVTDLPDQTPNCLMDWPFKALKQGSYRLQNCYLETSSRFGFWALRRVEKLQSEIRVYPDLFRERKKLSGLFLNRGIGIHAQRQVGKGREFEQLREYLPGDSYEDIHWKATARRGMPITKVYQIERTQQIYVIVDGSRLSARNSDPFGRQATDDPSGPDSYNTSIMERYAAAALVMGLAADRQGDVFGMLAFDDQVRKFVRAKSGRAHYDVCRDALYTLQARSVTPDFGELFSFIATKIRRRALLIILTNLDDPVLAENFTANIDLISRQHLVLVNMLKPAGVEPIFSDPAVKTVDDIYAKLGGHLLWRHLSEIEKFLQRRGIAFYMLENENMCSDLVTKYMSIKRRQIL
ncbi:MAG: DUF58 domain-containing protein [Deltaproteobacteria bacterium]|nr:DUF58 domain-containing protein [Deltaproteobacteria bacterium]